MPNRPTSPLRLSVGEDIYDTYVTAEELVDEQGGPAAGRCLWAERLILISSKTPPNTREEVWMHEGLHAWDYHFRRPESVEAATDWTCGASRAIRAQFERQGGAETLLAMAPVSGVAPSSVCKPPPGVAAAESRTPSPTFDSDVLLRKYRFPELDDHQYALAKALWESVGLDPLQEQCWVRAEQSPRGVQVKLVLTIQGLRARAHRTGQWAGHEPTEFVYGDDPYIPELCRFKGYRMVEGVQKMFIGEVTWREAYGHYDPEELADVVAKRPRTCLEICAEAAFLRRAFTEETKNLYVKEEWPSHRRAAKSMPTQREVMAVAAAEPEPDDLPGSSLKMHLRLQEIGYKKEADRNKVIGEAARSFGEVKDGQEPAFYAYVIGYAKSRKETE